MGYKRVDIQLRDMQGREVSIAGGFWYITGRASANPLAWYSDDQGTQINGTAALKVAQALNRGRIQTWLIDTVTSFDLHVMTPTGQWFTAIGLVPGANNELAYDTYRLQNVARIPIGAVTANSFTAGTEFDTGFDFTTGMQLSPMGVAFEVETLEGSRTIEVGLLSSESGGDADGLIDAISTASAVVVDAKSAATNTRGALYGGTTLDRTYVIAAAKSVTFTWVASSTVAKGYALLPYQISTPVLY